MARQQPEAKLTREIREAILKEHPRSVFWKIHGGAMQTAGIPDLVGCVRGVFVGIEVKVPGRESTLTKLQTATLSRIRDAEGIALGPVTGAEEAVRWLNLELEEVWSMR